MAIAYKTSSAFGNSTTTSLTVAVPALADGDYAVMWVFTLGSGLATPAGWTSTGAQLIDSQANLYTFWKYQVGAAAATNVVMSVPTGGSFGKVGVYTGATNAAPVVLDNKQTSNVSYWPSAPITTSSTAFIASLGILYSARNFSSFTTSGTISATQTQRSWDTFAGTYRVPFTDAVVTSATGGTLRATLSGTSTSDTRSVVIPEAGGIPVDTTPPAVAITAPLSGETMSGQYTMVAQATDDVGVTSVEFFAGTFSIGQATHGSGNTWSLSSDTNITPDGTYDMHAVAKDAAGNTTESAHITAIINNTNPPSPSGLSVYRGGIETDLNANNLTYWDGTAERGFWYQADAANQVSYWDGSTEKVLNLIAADPDSVLDGATYAAYGDSYGVVQSQSGVNYTASDLFPQQLAAALGTTVTNRHVNSYMAMDVAYLMNNTSSSSKWVPGSFQFVTVHVGGNDSKLINDAAGLNEYRNGVQAVMGLLRMTTRVLATSATTSGTWSPVASSGTSGGARSTSSAASLTFTATGDCTVFLLANRDGTGATYSVTVDGGAPITGTTVGQAAQNPVVTGSYGLVPIHLHGLGAGSHSVVVTRTGGGTLLVDSIGIWATDQSTVPRLLISAFPNAPTAFWTRAGVPVPSAAQILAYRNALRNALIEHAEVGRFAMVLPDSYDKMFFNHLNDPIFVSDGYHPNKAGCDILARIWIGNTRRSFPF